MKIVTLLLCSIFIFSRAHSQDSTYLISDDSLHTSSGFIVASGDKLKLGTGSLPDGDFK